MFVLFLFFVGGFVVVLGVFWWFFRVFVCLLLFFKKYLGDGGEIERKVCLVLVLHGLFVELAVLQK